MSVGVGDKVRLLDDNYTDYPAGTIGDVIEDGPFTGMFGQNEFSVVFPDDVDDQHWYLGYDHENEAWEVVNE